MGASRTEAALTSPGAALTSPRAALTSPHSLVLQHHPVEDEADVLGWGWGPGALLAQQVQDLGGQHGVLAVLDELAEVSQACLLALRVLLDDADYTIHNGSLVLKATLAKGNQGQ